MNFINANLLSFLALGIMVGLSIILYGDLPEALPTQFDLSGDVQRTQSKDFVIALIPAIYFGLIFLINLLIKISPHKFSMPNSKRAMDIIIFGIGILFCFIHFALLMNAGDLTFFLKYFTYGMAMFLIIVGNVFGKTERNFFIGIRLPWTIASEANWRATPQACGQTHGSHGIGVANQQFTNCKYLHHDPNSFCPTVDSCGLFLSLFQ